MGYTCRVWSVSLDKEKLLPPCGIQHRTLDAAMHCRVRMRGEDACYRWEIQGGDIVVAKGAGPVERVLSGFSGAVQWIYTYDLLRATVRVVIQADGHNVIDSVYPRLTTKIRPDHAAGMAMMLDALAKTDPDWAAELIARSAPVEPLEELEELPANVVRGPWRNAP